jgi:translocation and assembly module TamA
VRRLYRRAPAEIEDALRALGYYHPKIQSELTPTDKGWRARFNIEPGPPVRITHIDLDITGEGASDPAFERFIQEFPFQKGDILNHGQWESAKSRLQSIAVERGYFEAELETHRFVVDLKKNEATMSLHFDTGPRYSFGPVLFEQSQLPEQKNLNEGLLKRFVPFKPGDPFVASRLIELQTALMGSGYFTSVEVQRLLDQTYDHRVPIQVVLRADKKYRLSLGAGFGTDTGPRGEIGWQIRRVNPRGHKFSSRIEGSLLGVRAQAAYEIPHGNPLTEVISFGLESNVEMTDTYESNVFALGGQRTDALGGGWFQTIFLNAQEELYKIGGQNGESFLVIPGVRWKRVRADTPIAPRHGSLLFFELRGTETFLGSDVSFFQGRAQGQFIRGVGERHRILLRSDLGATLVDDFTELPPSVRFFAGGSDNLRGFDYESLGPRNSEGDVIGGRYLATGSAEYEYRLLDKWGLAVFYDVGNAFNDSFNPNLAQDTGVGLRWFSPVGPIRIDFAFAVSEPDAPFRLSVRMGPDL